MHARLIAAALTSLLLLSPGLALPADEQHDEPDIGMETCVNVSRIRNTRVVDDRNILFYTRNNKIYQNILTRPCPSLAREKRFSYRVTGSSLCRLDWIYVLYAMPGGMRDGPSCSLGYFHEITEEDAEAIIEGPSEAPPAKPLPPAEPEDMNPESSDPESSI